LIRVLVAAKSAITRAGLESLVRADARFEVTGDGYRDGDLLRAAREHAPDVILFDAAESAPSLPGYLHQPGAPALVLLVGNITRSEARRILQAGALAILPRDSAEDEITAAIEAAAAGLAVFTPEILEVFLPAAAEISQSGEFPVVEPLTSREGEVLSLMAEGAGNKEIASRLHISEHTAKFHVSSILAKLGAATRTEAVTRGYKEGLIVM
jgi:NarL family two-component system response regulator YdfI